MIERIARKEAKTIVAVVLQSTQSSLYIFSQPFFVEVLVP